MADDTKVPSCRWRLVRRGAWLLAAPRSLDVQAPWYQADRGTSTTKVAAIAEDPWTIEGIGSMLSAQARDRGTGMNSVPTSPMSRGRHRSLVARANSGPTDRHDLDTELPARTRDRGTGMTSIPIFLEELDCRYPEGPWSPGIMGRDSSRDHGTEATRRPWNLATHPAMHRGRKEHPEPM